MSLELIFLYFTVFFFFVLIVYTAYFLSFSHLQNLTWIHLLQLSTTEILFFLNYREYRHRPIWIFQSPVTKSIIILACVLVLFSPLLYHSSYPLLGITLFLPPSIHYPLSLCFNISPFTCSFPFSFNLPQLSPITNKQPALHYFISCLPSLPSISFLQFTTNLLKRVVSLL